LTLIIGARCQDGIILATDRRRLARYEKGPDTSKLFKLDCGILLAGAGDDAVLNEARVFIEHRIKGLKIESTQLLLFDIVEITMSVVNELVNCYKDKIEESFGYVLAGLENLSSGQGRIYTIFIKNDLIYIMLFSLKPLRQDLNISTRIQLIRKCH